MNKVELDPNMSLQDHIDGFFSRTLFRSYETIKQLVDHIIAEGGDLNIADRKGESLLDIFLDYAWHSKSNCTCFQSMLDHGLDVFKFSSAGETPLMAAYCHHERPDSTEKRSFAYKLLKHVKNSGASVKDYVMRVNPKNFQSALHMAAIHSTEQSFKNFLFALKTFLTEEEFKEVLNQKVEIPKEDIGVLSLQEMERSPYGTKVVITRNYGNNALHMAMQGGNVKTAMLLNEAGLSFNTVNEYGMSPLMVAADSNYYGAMAAVLDMLAAKPEQDISFLGQTDGFGRDLMYILYKTHEGYAKQQCNNNQVVMGIKCLCHCLKKKGDYELNALEDLCNKGQLERKSLEYDDRVQELVLLYHDPIRYLLCVSCRDRNMYCGLIALEYGADPDFYMDYGGVTMPAWQVLAYRRVVETSNRVSDTCTFLMQCIRKIREEDPDRFTHNPDDPDFAMIKQVASGALLNALELVY